MRALRISLLNIVAAGVLVWLCAALIDKTISLSSGIWTAVLIVLILVVDQFFRMMLKSLTRVWLVETIFIILSLLGIWIVRYIF